MSVRFESTDCKLRGQLMTSYCRPILLETRSTRRMWMGQCTGRPWPRRRRRGSGTCSLAPAEELQSLHWCVRSLVPNTFPALEA